MADLTQKHSLHFNTPPYRLQGTEKCGWKVLLAAVCPKKVAGKLLGCVSGAFFFLKVLFKESFPRPQGRLVAFWTVKLGDTGAAACPRLFCQA